MYLSCLEPAWDTMKVEGMVTHTPGHRALLTCGAGLIGLALDTQVHDVVPRVKRKSLTNLINKSSWCKRWIIYFPESKFLYHLQIAQLSTTISQAQRATAFHFFTSNLFLSLVPTLLELLGDSLSLSTSIADDEKCTLLCLKLECLNCALDPKMILLSKHIWKMNCTIYY